MLGELDRADGKVYCFSTEGSKEAFLKNPAENIQKAQEFFLAKDLAKNNAAPGCQPADRLCEQPVPPRTSPRTM